MKIVLEVLNRPTYVRHPRTTIIALERNSLPTNARLMATDPKTNAILAWRRRMCVMPLLNVQISVQVVWTLTIFAIKNFHPAIFVHQVDQKVTRALQMAELQMATNALAVEKSWTRVKRSPMLEMNVALVVGGLKMIATTRIPMNALRHCLLQFWKMTLARMRLT